MKKESEYQETLHLPVTDFPMRGNLPKREPQMLEKWQKEDYYGRLQELSKAQGRPTYILHDGPPYANGNIHIGTALNKILKDIVMRSRNLAGCHVPYVPGWDAHGLPIELHVVRSLGSAREGMSAVEFRERCAAYAMEQVDNQRKQFQRLGVWGEWDNPYLTLDPQYEAAQIRVFGEMVEKGYVYKALRPVYWCASCQTALADAEIEYADHRSPSIFVRFPVKDGQGVLEEEDTYFVIWTTTPWTIPANLAIALHPFYDYVLVQTDKGRLVLAKELAAGVLEELGLEPGAVVAEFKGSQLEGIVCTHPLMNRDSVVILGDHVTLDAGTGCVHTAPGHGHEDYVVGLQYDLPILSPVDGQGRFTDEAGPYAGLTLDEGNKAVVKDLDSEGALLKMDFVDHSYPHCWRCKNPVMYRVHGSVVLYPLISSGIKCSLPLKRWNGSRAGASIASGAWWPIGQTGAFRGKGSGACLSRHFTVTAGNQSSRLIPLNASPNSLGRKAPTLGSRSLPLSFCLPALPVQPAAVTISEKKRIPWMSGSTPACPTGQC